MELITYLSHCFKEERLIRWPDNCMPIKVFIAPFRWYKAKDEGYHYKHMVNEALNVWQKASYNKVSFKVVNNLNDSQINIEWKRVDRKSLGMCNFNYDNNGRLYSAEVSIGLSDGIIHTQYQDKNEVFHTIVHEIGHAIGLDHSPYQNDIMYVPHQYGVINISERDRLTLKWLYNLSYGATKQEILSRYKVPSGYDIDELIYKLENKEQFSVEMKQPEFKIPDKHTEETLHKEHNLLAEINKYNLSIQNINISPDLQKHIKKARIKKEFDQ